MKRWRVGLFGVEGFSFPDALRDECDWLPHVVFGIIFSFLDSPLEMHSPGRVSTCWQVIGSWDQKSTYPEHFLVHKRTK